MATNVATGEDSLCFRHYLHVPVASHRKALAQMLLADHSLAEVHLWHADRYRCHTSKLFCQYGQDFSLYLTIFLLF